jgi:hypothetical protein
VLVVALGLGLWTYNLATASWVRSLDDSMTMDGTISMMCVAFGLASGFLFGRAPKLFVLMTTVSLLTFLILAVYFRQHPLEGPPRL